MVVKYMLRLLAVQRPLVAVQTVTDAVISQPFSQSLSAQTIHPTVVTA